MITIPAITSEPGDWFGNNGLNSTYDLHLVEVAAEKVFVRPGLESIVEQLGTRNFLPRSLLLQEPPYYVLARTMGNRSIYFPDIKFELKLSELGYDEEESQEFVLREKGGGLALDGILSARGVRQKIGSAILKSIAKFHKDNNDPAFGTYAKNVQQNGALISAILGMEDRYERPEGGHTLELSLLDLKTRPFVRTAPIIYVTKHGKSIDKAITEISKIVKKKAWLQLAASAALDSLLEKVFGYFNRNPFYGEITDEPFSSEYQLVPSVIRMEDFFKADLSRTASLISRICPTPELREQAKNNYCRDIARYLGHATQTIRHKKDGNYAWGFTGDIELIFREPKVQSGYLHPPRIKTFYRKAMSVIAKDVLVNRHLWFADLEAVHNDRITKQTNMARQMQLYLVNIFRDFGNFLTIWEMGSAYLDRGTVTEHEREIARHDAVTGMLKEMAAQGYLLDWDIKEAGRDKTITLNLNYRNPVKLQKEYSISFSQLFLR